MRSIAGENPNRAGKNRTLRAIERPRAESNRQGGARFERVKNQNLICRSPRPGEHATPRTFRGRVAVPTLTSGQQPEVDMDCDTAGSRTPQRGKNIRKSLAIPFVPCPRALSQRGAGNQFIIYSMKKNRGEWGVEPRSTQESRNRCSPYCTASHDGCRKHYYQSSMR